MIVTTLFEFSYIPTIWINSSHLTHHLLFLLVTLAITSGPTFYIAIVESNGTGSSLSLILGVVQFSYRLSRRSFSPLCLLVVCLAIMYVASQGNISC
jgi:hypothetical protein